MRYDQYIVVVGARYEHVRIHERYGSTDIPLDRVGHSPRLEQVRDPFRFPTLGDEVYASIMFDCGHSIRVNVARGTAKVIQTPRGGGGCIEE